MSHFALLSQSSKPAAAGKGGLGITLWTPLSAMSAVLHHRSVGSGWRRTARILAEIPKPPISPAVPKAPGSERSDDLCNDWRRGTAVITRLARPREGTGQ